MVKILKISARNQIPGIVKLIKKGPVSTEVVISVAGGTRLSHPSLPNQQKK